MSYTRELSDISSKANEIIEEYIDNSKRGDISFDYPDKWLISHLYDKTLAYKFTPLVINNVNIKPIQRKFPKTMEIIKNVLPNTISVFFSLMDSGLDLKSHKIPGIISNISIRAELPLVIPQPSRNCGRWINGVGVSHYAEDTWLIYDASLNHNSFNYSKGTSIVLTFDIIRPYHINKGNAPIRDLSKEMKEFIDRFMT